MKILLALLIFLAGEFTPATLSTGTLTVSVQAEIGYSKRFEGGEMLVLLTGVPQVVFVVEARRKVAGREVVVGRSAQVCRCGAGEDDPIEVSVWPIMGRTLRAGDYPVVVLGGEK